MLMKPEERKNLKQVGMTILAAGGASVLMIVGGEYLRTEQDHWSRQHVVKQYVAKQQHVAKRTKIVSTKQCNELFRERKWQCGVEHPDDPGCMEVADKCRESCMNLANNGRGVPECEQRVGEYFEFWYPHDASAP